MAVEANHLRQTDSFGLGWRPQLALGILSNLDRIDLVEVIADDFLTASRRERRTLQTLAAQVPVTLHGVSLGLASSVKVDRRRLDQTARLCEEIKPLSWSEHLAFVRGGGIEIGHLAAPPRCDETIEGTLKNLSLAHTIVGVAPQVENVATLIDPPLSCYDEACWVSEIICNSQSDLLLDLHNLHANALNFGYDPTDFISRIPVDRVRGIHLSGGRWIGRGNGRRVLDDHLHDVPDPVYVLLEEIGSRTKPGLTIILERDGDFPSIECLLDQLDQARQALARGRARRANRLRREAAAVSAPIVEAFLARIYVDAHARERFLSNPAAEALAAGLSPDQLEAVQIDRVGLELFAASLERKKQKHHAKGGRSSFQWGKRIRDWFSC